MRSVAAYALMARKLSAGWSGAATAHGEACVDGSAVGGL